MDTGFGAALSLAVPMGSTRQEVGDRVALGLTGIGRTSAALRR